MAGDHFWTTANSTDGSYRGIYKWDVESGASHKISADQGLCNVFLDRGEKFLFANMDKGVRILEADSGNEISVLYELGYKLDAMAFAPDERRLAAGDVEGQIYVWDVDLSNPSRIIPAAKPRVYSIHKGVIYSIAFASDGKPILSVAADGSVRRTMIDAHEPFRELTGLFKFPYPLPHSGAVHVAVFPNESFQHHNSEKGVPAKRYSMLRYPTNALLAIGTLAAGVANNHLKVLRVDTGEVVFDRGYAGNSVSGSHFSMDATRLAVVSLDNSDQRIDVIELQAGKIECYSPPETVPRWARFCTDNGLIGWLSRPGQLVCWNVPDKTVRWQTEPMEVRCTLASLSPDRKSLITANDQDMALVDCADGLVLYQVP